MLQFLLASVALAHPAGDGPSTVRTTTEARREPAEHGISLGLDLGVKPSSNGRAPKGVYLPLAWVISGDVTWRPRPAIGFSLAGAFTPAHDSFTSTTWIPVTRRTLGGEKITPDVVRSQARVAAMVVLSPVDATLVRPAQTSLALDLGLGFGAVHTLDDLEALQAENDPVAQATAVQWHPSLTWLAGPRIALGGAWSSTLRVRGTHWVEVLEGINLESVSFLDFSLGLRRGF